mmetsp:Transcript_24186/g.51358  ORF Transcript_24186/g.51358 Transcript_24186/m.51358 type:complete len:406 (-) Transcript_24186:1877-3094(-)
MVSCRASTSPRPRPGSPRWRRSPPPVPNNTRSAARITMAMATRTATSLVGGARVFLSNKNAFFSLLLLRKAVHPKPSRPKTGRRPTFSPCAVPFPSGSGCCASRTWKNWSRENSLFRKAWWGYESRNPRSRSRFPETRQARKTERCLEELPLLLLLTPTKTWPEETSPPGRKASSTPEPRFSKTTPKRMEVANASPERKRGQAAAPLWRPRTTPRRERKKRICGNVSVSSFRWKPTPSPRFSKTVPKRTRAANASPTRKRRQAAAPPWKSRTTPRRKRKKRSSSEPLWARLSRGSWTRWAFGAGSGLSRKPGPGLSWKTISRSSGWRRLLTARATTTRRVPSLLSRRESSCSWHCPSCVWQSSLRDWDCSMFPTRSSRDASEPFSSCTCWDVCSPRFLSTESNAR